MSDSIKHECGIAMIRLLKPMEYYQYRYGSWRYGLEKMYLLMEKQHNRGQDGAGLVSVKFDTKPGNKYISRERSVGSDAINDVFKKVYGQIEKSTKKGTGNDLAYIREKVPFASSLYLGHLRYGTFGKNKKNNIHPVLRENNWRTRNLVLAGNFNLTNVDEIFDRLIELGQHPKDYSDTVTILENVGHFLDREVQRLFEKFKQEDHPNSEITHLIAKHLDVGKIIADSSKRWDGGYVIAGLLGHGDAFVTRDPWGIRPCYYYADEDIVVVASERPVIQTAMNLPCEAIKELSPGGALIMKKDGDVYEKQAREQQSRKACSFERIYFSRGGDADIYRERMKLGELLIPEILDAVKGDYKNTVFSFIPNTAEIAFYGMIKGFENHINRIKSKEILALKEKELNEEKIQEILSFSTRIEKTTIKDIKLRTFISEDKGRNDLVAHVYDITYGTIKKGEDSLVVIDDSIVRGTTLKQSILKILDRLEPKEIVVVSSSPQIRYPDCYGIDMTRLGDFIAFRAAIELLHETGMSSVINQVYKKSKSFLENSQDVPSVNYVKEIYKPFTAKQISEKIAQMLMENNGLKSNVKIVYQSIENLHAACPDNLGDWYFTGNYPTPGGNKVVNRSFVNFVEGINERSY